MTSTTTAPLTVAGVYRSRSISRQRRTPSQMDDLREAIFMVLKAENPMTVRQVFYGKNCWIRSAR